MTVQEFKEYDHSFDGTNFITKVNNIIVKYFNSITLNEIDKVDHFVGDKVFETGKRIIKDAEDNGCVHMFDELNIRGTNINSIDMDENAYYIHVRTELLYMDYMLDKKTGKLVSGDNSKRTSHLMIMTFKKNRNATEQTLVRTCPTCGASLNTNNTGICEYCHTVYDQENHDWVLEEIAGFDY